MRKLFTLILLFPFWGFSQQAKNEDLPEKGLPEQDGKVFIEEVIDLKDSTITKDKIFLASKEWISKTFKSSKSVIDYEDKTEGKIVCKGLSKQTFRAMLGGTDEITVNYTIDITMKNGKYRIQMYNLRCISNNYSITGSQNPYISDTSIDIDKYNNVYNNHTEKNNRQRKYYGKEILKIGSIIYPVFKDATESIGKNVKQLKSNDF
jgi:Domain of unknown function (DUF4468) with TBP-like fold